MAVTNEDIADYFNRQQATYTRYWSPTALHYGFWDEGTKNLAEAIANTDRFVVDALGIGPGDRVLDAGCGVGGSSMFIAQAAGARLEGITLSPVQLEIARERAARSPAAARLNFSIQDYTRTDFSGASFTQVFGIESICYARRKIDFLNEAFRVLAPGGRLAVVDAFLTRETLDTREEKIYRRFLEGWVLPNLPTKDAFAQALAQAGFVDAVYHDKTRAIAPSSRKIHLLGRLSYPLDLMKSVLGIGRDNFSALYQRALFERGIATYGVFVATKPA